MKAQELSKMLVAPSPSISKVSNYQLRLRQTTSTTSGLESVINRSRSRDNNGPENNAIYESDENVY